MDSYTGNLGRPLNLILRVWAKKHKFFTKCKGIGRFLRQNLDL